MEKKKWKNERKEILKNEERYKEVERILVNKGIKKKIWEKVKGERRWIGKVRKYWGKL